MARILVIEPDSAARELLESFVTGLGHDLVGPQDKASGPGPDLVLLEPADRAALEQAKELRDQHERLPIVCVSSEHLSDEVEELEVSAFLMKPFRSLLLEWAIVEALAGALVPVAA